MFYFLPPESPQLKLPAAKICPCHIRSTEIKTLLDELIAMAQKSVSAPQVGVMKQIIIIDGKVYINPEIVWRSDSLELDKEECPSTGAICGIVPRHAEITVQAFNREAKSFVEDLSGEKARRAQHEIDHLHGIRFPDLIENESDLHLVAPEEKERYKNEWQTWGKKCSKEYWRSLAHP